MAKQVQAIRGMNDCLPDDSQKWQHVESILRDTVAAYGYAEIRMPIVENTVLFKRSIGEITDIVEKEMYTFDDRNGDSLTLRPEGTAGCVRAGNEHGLLYNQEQRLWYMGPMFRHERPQKGRYRQFHQFGVEAFGMAGPDIDAEIIAMTASLWQRLGVAEHVRLEINSLGTSQARVAYREALLAFLEQHKDQLDEDSQRRMYSNPLRVLDSKNPQMQELLVDAPKLSEYLDEESQQHLRRLCEMLDALSISYQVNEKLVRGLDYYNCTVFEWITDSLGAQGTVCAGGRYDGLVEQLGGKGSPAVGFALGLERLVLLLETLEGFRELKPRVDVYAIAAGDSCMVPGLTLANELRQKLPGIAIMSHMGGGNFKKLLKKADKSGARFALILGENELQQQRVTIKYLREDKPQEQIEIAQLADYLSQLIA